MNIGESAHNVMCNCLFFNNIIQKCIRLSAAPGQPNQYTDGRNK